MLVNCFNLDADSTIVEKRELAKKPEFSLTKDYPQMFDQYYSDNFGLRSLFVKWNSKIKLDYFKISPKPELVIFGKNDFLFYNSKSDDIYDSYSNNNLFNNYKLDSVYKKQVSLKKTLESKNIKYIVGFFPNKHTIYKEELPYSMKMQIKSDTTLADQLVSYFKSKSFPFVDVREALLSAKEKKQVYYKFDSHWNDYGAYIGYKSFCKETFNTLNLTPFETSDFNINYSQRGFGDLTNMIGTDQFEKVPDTIHSFTLKDTSRGFKIANNDGYPNKTIITINKNCDNQKTVLVYRDSFSSAFVQFFSLHYHKVIYIWSDSINMKLVEKINPEILVSLHVERRLKHL